MQFNKHSSVCLMSYYSCLEAFGGEAISYHDLPWSTFHPTSYHAFPAHIYSNRDPQEHPPTSYVIPFFFLYSFVRPSFMGIVFGVSRNGIWEFRDPNNPILWGCIWPNTTTSFPTYIYFALDSIVFRSQMRWRLEAIVFAVFDLT